MKNLKFAVRALNLAVAMSAAMGASSGAIAYQYPGQNEAAGACFNSLKQTLHIGNYDKIEREYGVKELGGKTYAFYINVGVRDDASGERVPMKVYCVSEGFASVRAFEVDAGRWVYKVSKASAEEDAVAINNR